MDLNHDRAWIRVTCVCVFKKDSSTVDLGVPGEAMEIPSHQNSLQQVNPPPNFTLSPYCYPIHHAKQTITPFLPDFPLFCPHHCECIGNTCFWREARASLPLRQGRPRLQHAQGHVHGPKSRADSSLPRQGRESKERIHERHFWAMEVGFPGVLGSFSRIVGGRNGTLSSVSFLPAWARHSNQFRGWVWSTAFLFDGGIVAVTTTLASLQIA